MLYPSIFIDSQYRTMPPASGLCDLRPRPRMDVSGIGDRDQVPARERLSKQLWEACAMKTLEREQSSNAQRGVTLHEDELPSAVGAPENPETSP